MNPNRDIQEGMANSWIEKLALEELNMEESGVINFSGHLDPQIFLEEASIQLMEEIKSCFKKYVDKFNFYRGDKTPGSSIKIFKISNTVNDFMLFRNSLKLIIGRKSHDLISVGFLSNTNGPFSARLNNQNSKFLESHDINAHIGPFNEITWRFQGEIVNIQSLTKHYLTEFIRYSSR